MSEPLSIPQEPGAGPRCPFCGSAEVELFSLFGSQLLTEQWYCRACRTPFERLHDRDAGRPSLPLHAPGSADER